MVGIIRVSQLLSALLILAGILLLILIRKGIVKARDYSGKYCLSISGEVEKK